jgi:predicted phosphoadenosine phosphosulfate sulfurtransferase
MPNNGSQLSFENVKLIPEMTIDEIVKYLIEKIKILTEKEKVSAINKIKIDLHEISPFCNEPVDCVLWVENTNVVGNDYNPNKVAPPELESKCWAPSWRRMCKVLLRNDYWCKGLGQTQPKSEAYQRYKEMKKQGLI